MITEINVFKEYHFIAPTTTVVEVESWISSLDTADPTTIMVPPLLVKRTKAAVADKQIGVATIIGFPSGFNAIESKLSDIILAMVDGAAEMLVALNMTALKNGDWQYLAKELSMLVQVVKAKERKLSIAVNAALLTTDEIVKCCDLYGVAGIDSFTINTNDAEDLLSIELIQFFRQHLAEAVKLRIFTNSNYDAKSLSNAGIGLLACKAPVK